MSHNLIVGFLINIIIFETSLENQIEIRIFNRIFKNNKK